MSRRLSLASALLLVPVLAACTSSTAAGTPVTVTAGKGTCTVAPTSVPAGSVTITATYTGEGTGEVYLYAQENGAFTKILGEVEDLTTTPKSFTAEVTTGAYEVKCEGGGQETRVALTVG
ncbi:MAG: hypothetical protein U0S36_00680 [Candidatus Nanopelagicales bacterium]